ncbi:MAG TPA: phosphoenolpyruvate--protein phosphotransferase [Solirubrobacteraceae bacterium]|jgi:phosphocarrier protein FPr|nr:phosphoenolpyruvate--protein phosphotransferase [Solirubrobacteraceae bacterium]
MVGIVVVSHSAMLAEGVVRLAREMAGEELALEPAGGIEDDDPAHPVLGTDADRVRSAIERAMSPDGVLVLMDLGSALMSAEFAVELLDGAAGPVRLSAAPLVEGTVAAAVAASAGASLEEVAAEARGALAMKAGQISDGVDATADSEADVLPSDASAELEVRNAIGLHARPAARFVETARRFDADVRVAKAGGGNPVRAGSLTNLVALGARFGDSLVVTASGAEAEAAVRALQELAQSGFGDGVTSEPTPAAQPRAVAEPRPVAAGGAVAEAEVVPPPAPGAVLSGVAASGGVAIGPAHRIGGGLGEVPADRAADDPETERRRLDHALDAARAGIEHDRGVVAARAGDADAAIFDAHAALLDDDALLEPAHAAISAGATAERAWYGAAQEVAAIYRGLDEPLLRERATDVLDVGRRVVDAVTGAESAGGAAAGVIIADELTPADAAALDPERVLAIATARGSPTAHAAILSRALGLPAVVGLGAPVLGVADGTILLLDGEAGTVTVDPPPEVMTAAAAARERLAAHRAAALKHAHEPAVTRDGVRIEVFANLGAAGEAARAVELGAEGVGLLRTEFLFLGRDMLPDEDEQADTLRRIAVALDGRPLVVRTLDAGADKPLPALPMPPEENPFLGVRGIRLTLERPDVLATQFRAILRVAAEYPVKTMLPMVATLDEILAARAVLAEARAQTGIDAPMELGIMVEVPAAALGAERLARHVDFFSLGTNDLTQYTMAAERGDARLAALLAGPQPAVLRLVRATVEAAAAHGRWVGVCGELAGDPAAAVLLAGLGVTELSMATGLVPGVKAALREVELAQARSAALAALDTDSADAARRLALELL